MLLGTPISEFIHLTSCNFRAFLSWQLRVHIPTCLYDLNVTRPSPRASLWTSTTVFQPLCIIEFFPGDCHIAQLLLHTHTRQSSPIPTHCSATSSETVQFSRYSDSRYQASYLFHSGFFLGLFLDPEDGDDMFLRNVANYPSEYTLSYRRRQKSYFFSDILKHKRDSDSRVF
jgi:hypothetical protein